MQHRCAIQIKLMQDPSLCSQAFVSTLFSLPSFIAQFKQLQIQINKDLPQPSARQCAPQIAPQPATSRAAKLTEIDNVVTDINDLIVDSFRELFFKEVNTVYDNRNALATLAEELQSIKQSIGKMNQASSFVGISGKTLTTYESITDRIDSKATHGKAQNLGRTNGKETEASMFMDEEQQSSIDLGVSRKNLMEDRMGSFSFMNSFLHENKISPQEEEIINERINASISKVQSSIDDRITQLQKEFSRRIEQVMKTMGHFIQMMNQTERKDSQSPFKKSTKREPYQNFQQVKTKAVGQHGLVSSKSTIILPQKKVEAAIATQQQQKGPARSNKLASFFGLGRLNTSEK